MEKYLYLTLPEWTKAWVDGGPIPLKQASYYLSEDRQGTSTPDENLIDSSTHDLANFPGLIYQGKNSHVEINLDVLTMGDREYHNFNINRTVEDGLILSLCNVKSNWIAKRFGKVACVKIIDVHRLKRVLDEQIGVESVMQACTYTDTHHRTHFQKSSLDSWQQEFRLFWRDVTEREVILPAGIAIKERIRCR